jgi:hypothetical protein
MNLKLMILILVIRILFFDFSWNHNEYFLRMPITSREGRKDIVMAAADSPYGLFLDPSGVLRIFLNGKI